MFKKYHSPASKYFYRLTILPLILNNVLQLKGINRQVEGTIEFFYLSWTVLIFEEYKLKIWPPLFISLLWMLAFSWTVKRINYGLFSKRELQIIRKSLVFHLVVFCILLFFKDSFDGSFYKNQQASVSRVNFNFCHLGNHHFVLLCILLIFFVYKNRKIIEWKTKQGSYPKHLCDHPVLYGTLF
jgi:hypothetical protein